MNDSLSAVQSMCDEAGLNEELSEQLGRFAHLLVKHGKKVNLIGTLKPDRVGQELLLDSLELLHALPSPEAPRSLVDIGSGAGIPGIPLLLACPAWGGVLVEPRLKRAQFLNHALRSLRLTDRAAVEQLHWQGGTPERAAGPAHKPSIWVSRAVLAPQEWLERATGAAAAGDEVVVWTNGCPEDVQLEATPSATHTYAFGDARQRTIRVFVVP